MPKSDFVVELVNAFNLNNYYFDDVYTNFTVKGQKIVGSFVSGTNIKEYSQKVKEEIIKQHYSTEEVAGEYYNLNCFPFVLSGKRKKHAGKNLEVEFADSTNREVIRNLKIHFAREFMIEVNTKVAVSLEERGLMTAEKGYECVRGSVRLEETGRSSPYLYCISFGDRYCKENGYPSRFLEVFRNMYVTVFDEKLEECGLESSDFYEYEDGKLYIKDITNIDVIKDIAGHLRKQIALDFGTPGTEDSKVENFKDILSSLIFKRTGKSINAYEYDVLTDEKEKKDGNSFVLIPLTRGDDDQLESLKPGDMYSINTEYTNLVGNIKGKTEKSHISNCENPVYAISNKGIAQLLPEIMQFPIAYNERFKRFEFAADLGPSSSVESPRPDPVVSPVSSVQKTVVAVPGVVDGTKNNPGPSMSGQNPDEGYGYMQDSSQSVNTRDPSDAEEIRERYNKCNSADSALSSEFDASRSSSRMGMTDDSGACSSQEFFNGDIDNEKEPSAKLSQMKLGSPQRDQGKELKRSPRLESHFYPQI